MTSSTLDNDMEFRLLVANTARQLTSSNLEELHYIYGLPVQLKDCSTLALLQELQQRGHFSSAEDLAAILRKISREDLAQAIGDYRPVRQRPGCSITPAQLRGKCEANIAQINSLLEELKKIQVFLRRSSQPPSPDDLAQLWHQLEEIERGAYGLLGRCESAHKCCTVGQSQAQSVPGSENKVRGANKAGSMSPAGPQNRTRGHFISPEVERLHHQGQRTAQAPDIQKNARVAPVSPPGQKHCCLISLLSLKKNRAPSADRKGPKSPTSSPPPPPPDSYTKDGPDYGEPDLTAVGLSAVNYYASKDLVGDRRDLQTARTAATDKNGRALESPQSHGNSTQSQTPLTASPSTLNKVQSIAQKIAGCPIPAARAMEMKNMGAAKTQKPTRPPVPKKPDVRSCHTSSIPLVTFLKRPSSTSAPDLALHTPESDVEESGYSSSSTGSWSHSAGNSVAERVKGRTTRPPSKEWPSSLPERNYYKGLNRYHEHASDYL